MTSVSGRSLEAPRREEVIEPERGLKNKVSDLPPKVRESARERRRDRNREPPDPDLDMLQLFSK